ncbi:MAG: sulfotransferase [Gemmatimonadetes bacterium]|nr:sulfotransferase [Gemmatimonadota bacterium]
MAISPDETPSRFLFVLGTGRCGSSLVHEVLARHPHVGFVSNVEDNLPAPPAGGRWNNRLYSGMPARFTRKGRIRFAPSEGYRILEREVSPILSTPFRDLTAEDVTPWLARRFRGFFEARALAQGRPAFLHKFTGWPRAGFVHGILPEARFLHVVRDGRAVVNSWLQMPWWLGYRGPWHWQWGPLPEPYAREWEASGRSFVLLAGLAWKLLLDAFEAAQAAVPANLWMEMRYEDFVSDPAGSLRRALDFAGLEWTAGFEAGVARHSFESGRRLSYRQELEPAHLRLLDSSLAGHLERFGYGTGEPSGSTA